ncbi:MAG: UDP-N-acetylenolpyruvoylglucosamine reductase, partial [Thermoplasmata archaeon]|nr:UDP-N-acetylenolpyruvoylglucosamine reductase [Thermoplasmata archaeon]
MDPKLTAALAEIGVPFQENEPFSRHTSMGVGGPAAVMAFPRAPEELRQTLKARSDLGVPHRVLGGGS